MFDGDSVCLALVLPGEAGSLHCGAAVGDALALKSGLSRGWDTAECGVWVHSAGLGEVRVKTWMPGPHLRVVDIMWAADELGLMGNGATFGERRAGQRRWRVGISVLDHLVAALGARFATYGIESDLPLTADDVAGMFLPPVWSISAETFTGLSPTCIATVEGWQEFSTGSHLRYEFWSPGMTMGERALQANQSFAREIVTGIASPNSGGDR